MLTIDSNLTQLFKDPIIWKPKWERNTTVVYWLSGSKFLSELWSLLLRVEAHVQFEVIGSVVDGQLVLHRHEMRGADGRGDGRGSQHGAMEGDGKEGRCLVNDDVIERRVECEAEIDY